jgi:hypothetical protein
VLRVSKSQKTVSAASYAAASETSIEDRIAENLNPSGLTDSDTP